MAFLGFFFLCFGVQTVTSRKQKKSLVGHNTAFINSLTLHEMQS
jgi:hypothetical protein